MTARLTVYFIVEPPEFQVMACYLAASIRAHFGPEVALVGYCPAHRLAEVHDEVHQALARMNCALRGFEARGRFEPAYPHGNKLLATLEPRDSEFSCFMDSDILCLRPNRVESLICPGKVSLTPAASMGWAPQSIWASLYAIFDMAPPQERLRLMRQNKGRDRVPYFSSGLFCFPEGHRNARGESFAEVWMQTAQTLDRHPDVPAKRPYLDQISLPIAIQRAGLGWHCLPQEQHFILGGRLRGQPLPPDREIYTIHYRQWRVLDELGLSQTARKLLKAQAGVKRVAAVRRQRPAEPGAREAKAEKRAARRAERQMSGAQMAASGPVQATAAQV